MLGAWQVCASIYLPAVRVLWLSRDMREIPDAAPASPDRHKLTAPVTLNLATVRTLVQGLELLGIAWSPVPYEEIQTADPGLYASGPGRRSGARLLLPLPGRLAARPGGRGADRSIRPGHGRVAGRAGPGHPPGPVGGGDPGAGGDH